MSDSVNHPSHYKGSNGIETIECLESFLSPEGFEGYLAGNVAKYVARYRDKNGLEDLQKAQWYLNYLVFTKESRSEADDAVEEAVAPPQVECKDGFCPMPNVRFDPVG